MVGAGYDPLLCVKTNTRVSHYVTQEFCEEEALAFWLVEHRDGPGIPPTRAAALLGCKDHTSIRHAVDAYVEKNPKAPRWPDKHRDWNRRIPLGDDGAMAHHA